MSPPPETAEPLIELVGCIYDAAQDEQLWGALAPRIANAFNADSTALVTVGNGTVHVIARAPDIEDDARDQELHGHYRLLSQKAIDGQVQAFLLPSLSGSVAHQTQKNAKQHRDGGDLPANPGIAAIIPVASDENAILGLHRFRGEPYDDVERESVAKLLPHLQGALRLRYRLRKAAIAERAAFDRLDRSIVATLVVERDCRIAYTNPAAERLLYERRGIQSLGGRLAAADRTATERLRRAVALAIDGAETQKQANTGGGGILALPREGRVAPLTALVAPLRAIRHAERDSAATAILFIRDPAARRLACAPLQSLFGLTAAEAMLASGLAAGKSLEEIASMQTISLHTARAHLKSVFGKTGTSRQAQLVALLLSSVAGLASESIF